jgi:hypothetical protein
LSADFIVIRSPAFQPRRLEWLFNSIFLPEPEFFILRMLKSVTPKAVIPSIPPISGDCDGNLHR